MKVKGNCDTSGWFIHWADWGREPQCPADPRYPKGIDLDCSEGQTACTVKLPYPAKRCGVYLLECRLCRIRACVTTAGRRDDPRSVKLACKLGAN